MKTSLWIILIASLLSGCGKNSDLSDAYGNFEADEVMVSSETNGKILFLGALEGRQIDSGHLAAVIDTTDFVLKIKQLQAQKKAVKARLDNVRAQIEVSRQQQKNLQTDQARLEKLFRDGAATPKQMDDINGQIDLVELQTQSIASQQTAVIAEMELIDSQISQVVESIRRCSIINPVRGTVLERFAAEGEITAFGKPLYKIANLDEIILRVYVSGNQLPVIRIGQQVKVLVDNDKTNNLELPGTITWISQSAEFTPKIIQTKEERVNLVYAMKVQVKNDGSLKIGMPGEVMFQ